MAQERKRRKPGNDSFEFVVSKELKADITDALGFSAYLTIESLNAKEGTLKRELSRTNVLYVASVIEALCLFLLKEKKLSVDNVEYKQTRTISIPPEVSVSLGILVIALQVKETLQSIPFARAIQALKENKIITKLLFDDLDSVRKARNTQHLYARSSRDMSQKDVKNALITLRKLLRVIEQNALNINT